MHFADLACQHPHAEIKSALVKRGVERRTADSQPATFAEERFGACRAVHVADAAQFVAGDLDAQSSQCGDTARHDALAAGLVHGRGAGFDDDCVQAGERGVDGGGQTGRAAARHQYVDHAETGVVDAARARFSQRMRTVSRAALSRVNKVAVTQAVWISGRATPSATTAT